MGTEDLFPGLALATFFTLNFCHLNDKYFRFVLMAELDTAVADNDEALIGTNDEATQCKRYAIHKGYWEDPFIYDFSRSLVTKTPEINMGYYARVYTVKCMIDHFLEIYGKDAQIVNIGAGFDTLFWRLMKNNAIFKKYVEIDLPMVVYKKTHIISHRPNLNQYIEVVPKDKSKLSDMDVHLPDQDILSMQLSPHHSVNFKDHEIHSMYYDLISSDLRDIDMIQESFNELNNLMLNNLDYNKPTLFISECVLIYMESKESHALLKWITSKFLSTICFLNYEQVNMGDKFGEVMQNNLKARSCYLLGADNSVSCASQRDRFLNSGWDSAQVYTMLEAFDHMPALEKHRVLNVEFLDEKELLYQLLDHYCLCWACKNVPYDSDGKAKHINENILEIISHGTTV